MPKLDLRQEFQSTREQLEPLKAELASVWADVKVACNVAESHQSTLSCVQTELKDVHTLLKVKIVPHLQSIDSWRLAFEASMSEELSMIKSATEKLGNDLEGNVQSSKH